MSPYRIRGFALKGFESVRKMFEKNFERGMERGAQLCVYVGDKNIVDLWGATNKEPENYDGDSLCGIYSTAKMFDAIAIGTLVEKNLLRYSDRVVDHWPEFSKGDERKSSLTVAQIMKHEGGIPYLHKSLKIDDIQPDNVKENSIGRVIENEPLNRPPPKASTTRQYHAETQPLILNEIYRRVDPKGRLVGEWLIDDICKPLNADGYYGLDETQSLRAVDCCTLSNGHALLASKRRKIFPNLFILMIIKSWLVGVREEVPFLEDLGKGKMAYGDYYSIPGVKTATPAGFASARGLARMAGMMANRGTFNGVQVFSRDTWNKIHGDFETKVSYGTNGKKTTFSQGGVHLFTAEKDRLFKRRDGFVGWLGYGGSVFQWHPGYKIGFGYVPSLLLWEDFENSKAAFLQKEVVDCVKRMNGNPL